MKKSMNVRSASVLEVQRPGQPVPVGEVGGEVELGLEVMEVVVGRAAVQAERHQAVGGPGQVVAAVVLHRQPDVEREEGQLGERVAAQELRADGGEEAEAEGLPGTGVLGGEGGGGCVGVMHL